MSFYVEVIVVDQQDILAVVCNGLHRAGSMLCPVKPKGSGVWLLNNIIYLGAVIQDNLNQECHSAYMKHTVFLKASEFLAY